MRICQGAPCPISISSLSIGSLSLSNLFLQLESYRWPAPGDKNFLEIESPHLQNVPGGRVVDQSTEEEELEPVFPEVHRWGL